jgi:hypothetical protein
VYLVGLDTQGRGHAIVAVGNPDTAGNVATYLPGVGNSLAGIGGGIQRADRMFKSAGFAGSTSTAVITWFGYDAPSSVADPAALGDDDAKRGAVKLDRFQDGLRATHQGPPSHNTVIAHSYGGAVTGIAAQRPGGLHADDIVAVGSVGMEVYDARDLGVPAGHVWASKADDDRIAGLPIHGEGPTARRFGARGFDSGSGGWPWDAHSSYFNDNSPALRNMGRIIAGREDVTP